MFPIDDSCGWIEMVEKSNTLYDIKYKYQTTIQNYIMDLNPNLTVGRIRRILYKHAYLVAFYVMC